MTKTEYNYQTKRISHRILRKQISSHISDKKSAKVLCLPGAGAIEIIKVYDALGIPRKNILGFERNEEIYNTLKQKNLGIRLESGDITDFIKNTDEKFDVISLDYTQMPTQYTMGPIEIIGKNHLLSERSVLHTNFYASRISEFVKKNLPILVEHKKTSVGWGDSITTKSHRKFVTGNTKDFEKYGLNTKSLKDEGITTFIWLCLQNGLGTIEALKLGENQTRRKKRNSGKIRESNRSALKLKRPHEDRQATADFVNAFYSNPKPYLIKNLSRFSYVSNDGSLMMSDIFCLDNLVESFETSKKYFKGLAKDNKGIEFYDMENKRCSFNKSVKMFGGLISDHKNAKLKSEGFLDIKNRSARKDVTPRETLDRDTALKLLNSGWTYEKFEDRFKEITPSRIAAYKAHITMKTYEKEKIDPSPGPKKEKMRKKPAIKKKILFFDSDFKRSKKNLEKIDFGNNSINQTNLLNGTNQNLGILKEKQQGLYVLNTHDPKATEAVEELALRFCESNRYLNLFLIGNPNAFDDTVEAARELGAKINVYSYETNTGHIQSKTPIDLESLVL